MPQRRVASKAVEAKPESPVRVSVTIDPSDYSEIKDIAEDHRVSIAWVVRDAVATYLSARPPVLRRSGDEGS